jgi:hypothetical protein
MRCRIRALLVFTSVSGSFGCVGAPEGLAGDDPTHDVAQAAQPICSSHQPRAALIAWAALPASTRTPGPTSGQFIASANGVVPPFLNAQPVPGWSGLLANGNGTFTALPDNGYGSKSNSADYVLGFYTVRPDFKTWSDGTTEPGSVRNLSFTALNDRRGLLKDGIGVDLVITADRANYYSGDGSGADSGIPVDPTIRAGRLLTGYDFDVESIARAKDGTFWLGDEFGPYLLHVDSWGTLVDQPIPHPLLRSPQNPDVLAGATAATLAASRGFESLAFDLHQRLLYAVPEAAPSVDSLRPVPGDERVVEIFEFHPDRKAYTGRTFRYRKDGASTSNAVVIGDMTNLDKDVYVLIERDSKYGAAAEIKRLYLVDLNVADADGILEKRLLVDLLHIADPRDIGGDLPGVTTGEFDMPFDSIESVVSLGRSTLGVAIDTNYPNEDGRTPGVPDSTEFVKLSFDRAIVSYAPRRRH